VRLCGGNLVGLVLIVVGWYPTRHATSIRDSLAWLPAGLVGLGIAGVANGMFLYRGWHVIRLARVALLPDRPPLPESPGLGPGDRILSTHERPVTGDRMTRYHDPRCVLVVGKAVRPAAPERHQANGLRPCEVCEP